MQDVWSKLNVLLIAGGAEAAAGCTGAWGASVAGGHGCHRLNVPALPVPVLGLLLSQAERLALDKLAHDLVASNLQVRETGSSSFAFVLSCQPFFQQLDAWLADNEPRAAAFQASSLDPGPLALLVSI